MKPVSNFTVNKYNETTLEIIWTPLQSLLNVPIFHYHLSLNGLYTNTTLTDILSNTTVSTLLTIPDLCDDYIIQLYGVNEVGNGESVTTNVSIIEGM